MPISVDRVKLSDWDTYFPYKHFVDGDITTPGLLFCWPVITEADAERRNLWNIAQCKDVMVHDPTAVYLKAVDSETGESLALARWHYYEAGYPNTKESLDLELRGAESTAKLGGSTSEGLNAPFLRTLLSDTFDSRNEWMGVEPQWGMR